MESHHLITRDGVPRQLALGYFETVASSDPVQLDVTVDWIEQAVITLSLADCARDVRKFAGDKGLDISNPESISEALFSLEGLRVSLDWSATDLIEYLTSTAKKAERIPPRVDVSRFQKALDRFFSNSAKLERTLKAQRIYDGLLPNYESCSSLVEFRPVFDEARKKVLHGIISATLTIEMRANEYPAKLKKVSVQLDAADIDQLQLELTRLKKKISLLKERESADITLLNPSRADSERLGSSILTSSLCRKTQSRQSTPVLHQPDTIKRSKRPVFAPRSEHQRNQQKQNQAPFAEPSFEKLA
jgi:hypothetical protein